MPLENIFAILIILSFCILIILMCYKTYIYHQKKIQNKKRLKIAQNLRKSNKIRPFKIDELYHIV